MQTVLAMLGWCTLINIAMLTLSTVMLCACRGAISRFHARLFQLDETDLQRIYFQYLGGYKLITLTFNVVPYLALKLLVRTVVFLFVEGPPKKHRYS